MNLKKLQDYIHKFKNYLASPLAIEELYKWESLFHFQKNWDIDSSNFKEMYQDSLQNSKTKRLWKLEKYTPKKMMLAFIDMNTDYVQLIFKDLFKETAPIADRIDRFIYYCDDLLGEYKQSHPLTIENNHYQDYHIISVYLAFRYPEQYGIYDFQSFKKSMELLESRNIPEINDMERFFKTSNVIWKFLEKDKEVWSLHQNRLIEKNLYKEKSLLLVHEFFKMIERQ